MDYLKITLQEIPFIQFAHEHKTSAAEWFLSAFPSTEITYIKSGELMISEAGSQASFQIMPQRVFITNHEYAYTTHSPSRQHCHVTFAILHRKAEVISAAEVTQASKFFENHGEMSAILPRYINESRFAEHICQSIETIIYLHSLPTLFSSIRLHANILTLLAECTEFSMQNAERSLSSESTYAQTRYCRRAEAYIAEHLDRRISVPELAAYLNISEGHLCRVFKSGTGFTLSEYIASRKIALIKELLLTGRFSLAEAGAHAGIDDPKYVSRLFHRITGMTASEFLRKESKGSADSV